MKQKYHINLNENNETVIFKPRTIADELKTLIINDIVKDGKEINQKNIKEYKTKLNKAFDDMINNANQEFAKKNISL